MATVRLYSNAKLITLYTNLKSCLYKAHCNPRCQLNPRLLARRAQIFQCRTQITGLTQKSLMKIKLRCKVRRASKWRVCPGSGITLGRVFFSITTSIKSVIRPRYLFIYPRLALLKWSLLIKRIITRLWKSFWRLVTWKSSYKDIPEWCQFVPG